MTGLAEEFVDLILMDYSFQIAYQEARDYLLHCRVLRIQNLLHINLQCLSAFLPFFHLSDFL